MHGVRQAGLSVPHDISVIGFDDTRYAAVMNPPLTTITQPARAIGAESVNRLIRAIEGDSKGGPLATLLPHTLIKRGSVSPI